MARSSMLLLRFAAAPAAVALVLARAARTAPGRRAFPRPRVRDRFLP